MDTSNTGTITQTGAQTRTRPISKPAKIAAITIGNGLEFFDFSIYTYFAAMIGRTYFPTQTDFGSLMLSLATFGVGFLARPVGGVVIGNFADRHGRKPAMMLTLWLMALGSAVFIVTPGYQTIGLWAPLIIVLGRLVQGFAVGGEVGASTAMLLEYADQHNRGFYSSWQLFSQALSTLIGSGVGLLLTFTLSETQLNDWGWRIPFVVALLFIPLGSYIRRYLDETNPAHTHETPITPQKQKLNRQQTSAVRDVLRLHKKMLLIGFFLVLGSTSANYIVMHYLTTYAKSILHMPFSSALSASWLAGFIQMAFCALAGIASDRYGRKPVAIWSRIILMLLILPAFMLMDSTRNTFGLLCSVTILVIPLAFTNVSSLLLMSELFPRHVRATGLSLCYGLGVSIFGGFSQFFATGLIHITGSDLGPAWYVLITGILTLIAILICQETAKQTLD